MLIVAHVIVASGILAIAAFIWLESGWTQPTHRNNPEEAFRYGTIGTELLPLPVVEVLPVPARNHLVPDPPCKDWIACFGFIPGKDRGAYR